MKRDGVALLMVGDELLDGRTPDTNSHWLVERLTARRWRVHGIEVVTDDVDAIAGALHRWTGAVGAVIVSGGLGPTPDDLTRDALARLAGESMVEDEAMLAHIQSMLERRGRAMSPSNRRQALRPESAIALRNDVGTAPGLWQEVAGTAVVLVPGVPAELRWLMERAVEPRLAAHLVASDRRTVRLRTTGIAESRLADRVQDALTGAPAADLAWCVARFGVDLIVRHDDAGVVDDVARRLRDELGDLVFGEGSVQLNEVVVQQLGARNQTIALAESCTGGLVAGALTDVAGSSKVLLGGVVAYHDTVKTSLLDVDPALLAEHGAVSEPVVRTMAENVRRRLGATWGLSVSGIAGPGGGTEEKPVGTVWLGLAQAGGTEARRMVLGGDRRIVRRWTVAAALDALRRGTIAPRQ